MVACRKQNLDMRSVSDVNSERMAAFEQLTLKRDCRILSASRRGVAGVHCACSGPKP